MAPRCRRASKKQAWGLLFTACSTVHVPRRHPTLMVRPLFWISQLPLLRKERADA